MPHEKVTLISVFALFFLLSAILIYLMIYKDIKEKEDAKEKFRQEMVESVKAPNNWPKVEIETSK